MNTNKIKKKRDHYDALYQDALKLGEQNMNHHKEVHRKSNSKFCPDCGVLLKDRCPRFMEFSFDCGLSHCDYCVGVYYC